MLQPVREFISSYATRQAGGLLIAGLLGLPLLLGAGHAAPPAVSVSGPARVIDGDTIAIGEVRVRLEGIDAPELAQTCGRNWLSSWPCGRQAADQLARLLADREVSCRSKGHDAYGRMLGVCTTAGLELNAHMVRTGMAWAFVKYSQSYVEEEAEARALELGIWQGEAEPAWVYRAKRWSAAESGAPQGCAIKGNVTKGARIYHMPWSTWYAKTRIDEARGERWFCSEAEAVAAGWRPAMTH